MILRALLILGLMLPALPAAARGTAVILNSGSGSLSLIDMDSMTELKRVPVLREPHHVVLAPNGRELLVGDTAGNELFLLDPRSGEILRQVPMADPYQLGFSPDGKLLVVTGLARNQVDVYDASYKLLKRFPTGSMPSHIAFAPDSSMAFISIQGTNSLMALNLRDMSVLWTKEVGNTPAGVMWHDGKVLVANMGSDHFAVVDPVDGHVIQRVKTGRGSHQLFLSPDKRIIYVNNRVDGTTVAVDARTLQPGRVYKVPGGPDCIDFAPDGKLWITQRFAQKVAWLDPATGALTSIPVGRSPHGIYLTTDTPALEARR